MFKKKSKKTGKYTRLYNRSDSINIQVARFGKRFASNFPDNDQGWIDAVRYWYDRDLAEDGIEPLRPATKRITLFDAFKRFIEEYAQFRARKTREQYIYAMKMFFPDPSLYTTNQLTDIQTAIIGVKSARKTSETTINSYMRSLSTFFNWCVQKRIMKENPISSRDIPKPDLPEPKNWEDSELQRLFEYLKVKDVEFYCLIRLIYVTSMRIHQALGLKWENILREEECIRIKRKGRKEPYYFPITHQVESVLNLLPQRDGMVFKWQNGSRNRLYQRLNEACDELGIDRDGRAFHVFRKTRITKLAERNILLTSQSSDVSMKVMEKNYIRKKNVKIMKEFLEAEEG